MSGHDIVFIGGGCVRTGTLPGKALSNAAHFLHPTVSGGFGKAAADALKNLEQRKTS